MTYQFDRKVFFSEARKALGPLKQTQVDGFNALLDQACNRGVAWDKVAYYLATAWWETARSMQPVEEAHWVKNAAAWRKANLRYWPFYGRGYVQLTWEANYRKATVYFQQVLGLDVDFVKNPELACKPEYAAIIMFVGMEQGWFGAKLDKYLDGIDEPDAEDRREFTQARRTVNVMDRAGDIANLAIIFEGALRTAGYGPAPVEPVVPEPEPVVPEVDIPDWITVDTKGTEPRPEDPVEIVIKKEADRPFEWQTAETTARAEAPNMFVRIVRLLVDAFKALGGRRK